MSTGNVRMAPAGPWTITFDARPWTSNQDVKLHHYERARRIKEWREAFRVLALVAKVPPLERVGITAQPYYKRTQGKHPDPSSCAPATKAAIDGLVDASVVPDDGPRYVAWVKYLPAVMGAPADALAVSVEVVEPQRNDVHG
jgi:hypothetical protein